MASDGLPHQVRHAATVGQLATLEWCFVNRLLKTSTFDDEEEARASVDEQHLSSRIKKAISKMTIRQLDRSTTKTSSSDVYD